MIRNGTNAGYRRSRLTTVCLVALLLTVWPRSGGAQLCSGDNINATFGGTPAAPSAAYAVEQVSCSVPANVLYPKDKATFVLQIVSKTNVASKARGKALLRTYRTEQMPDDPFHRRFIPGQVIDEQPLQFELAPGAFTNLTVTPRVPETFGAYALVFEVEGLGWRLAAPLVRVLPPVAGKVQFPAFALDICGWNNYPELYALFQRCGIKAIRQESGVNLKDEASKASFDKMCRGLQEHDITLLVTTAACDGGAQPLGYPRKFLNDKDERTDFMLQDMCQLPSADGDFQKSCEYMAANYGWPKGPINAIELWNEPWEGCSISGWGADMLRYRDLYTCMAQGIVAAREKAGVQVLIGGTCSSMNTEDKLFGDGKETFLKWLDFTSIHYQPMAVFPALIPQWMERKSPYGPVKVWDTESWMANSEARICGSLACMRAQGQSRTAGVQHDFSYTVDHPEIRKADGTKQKLVVAQPWANLVAISAFQHFVGERTFKEVLFKNGLPWVFVFNGLPGKDGQPDPDDETMVIVGDLGYSVDRRDRCRFRTVFGIENAPKVAEVNARIAQLPPTASQAQRDAMNRQLMVAQQTEGASMKLADPRRRFRVYDGLGNPVDANQKILTIPLSVYGHFVRTDGSKGSFQALVEAVKKADIRGYEPVEIVAYDFTNRLEKKPALRLKITNVLNRPISGKLSAMLGDLKLAAPAGPVTLDGQESKVIELAVVEARTRPDNTYPLAATFDAGSDGAVTHTEDLHVNLVSRKTIAVDGDLKDWEGVLPQIVTAGGAVGHNLTEKAWLPMMNFDDKAAAGVTTAYLAYDDKAFYFAAKVADDTPWEGGVRYATRDDDQYFYPEKSYDVQRDAKGKEVSRRVNIWPEGVRRFSYRKVPDIPSGADTDNIQLGFGVFEPGQNGTYACPPGTMPRFEAWQCTDYEYALNPVSEKFGGGTEIWRLIAPGVPRKHFYPRQPKAEKDGGPVTDGKLAMKREGNTRIVEAAIPWSELPEVKKRLDAGEPVRFTFRVNDNKGPAYELNANRSVSQLNGYSLHNLWEQHWSTETEFAFEK